MTEYFPDGTPISAWFYDTAAPTLAALGRAYDVTDFGIADDGRVHTDKLQALIDKIAAEGGGVLCVPAGTFLTGALFFRQGVHLHIAAGGCLKGSDDICDYPVLQTRIEGETCAYFSALLNADGVRGFVMCGEGVVDGSGLRAWKAFWLRRKWNPQCTNKDEQRPRLVYLSHCTDVTISGLTLQNSPFWTTHLYRCQRVKYLGCKFFAPAAPVRAPSTDAVDIDACSDVLIKNCRLEVNDDAVALKGGKGPWADTAPENGPNERVLIEDCEYGFCHSALTCGSESIHSKNILLRRCTVASAYNLLWLKMRPDTPQHYEYITVEDVCAHVSSLLNVNPWRQFYNLGGRRDIPLSYADHVTLKNCTGSCDVCFNVKLDDSQYRLSDFVFRDLDLTAKRRGCSEGLIPNTVAQNVTLRPDPSPAAPPLHNEAE